MSFIIYPQNVDLSHITSTRQFTTQEGHLVDGLKFIVDNADGEMHEVCVYLIQPIWAGDKFVVLDDRMFLMDVSGEYAYNELFEDYESYDRFVQDQAEEDLAYDIGPSQPFLMSKRQAFAFINERMATLIKINFCVRCKSRRRVDEDFGPSAHLQSLLKYSGIDGHLCLDCTEMTICRRLQWEDFNGSILNMKILDRKRSKKLESRLLNEDGLSFADAQRIQDSRPGYNSTTVIDTSQLPDVWTRHV